MVEGTGARGYRANPGIVAAAGCCPAGPCRKRAAEGHVRCCLWDGWPNRPCLGDWDDVVRWGDQQETVHCFCMLGLSTLVVLVHAWKGTKPCRLGLLHVNMKETAVG